MGRDFLGMLERGLHFVDQVEGLGPLGVGHIIWESMSAEQRDRLLGRLCVDCGCARAICECCETCGYTPCACDARWPEDAPRAVIDVEAEELC